MIVINAGRLIGLPQRPRAPHLVFRTFVPRHRKTSGAGEAAVDAKEWPCALRVQNAVLCEQFIEKTNTESKCLYYGFSFDGDQVHCREGYADAEGLLAHLDNVGALLGEALKIAELTRLEVHGPEQELAKLRGPLADFNPQYFILEYGFRR